MDKSSIFGLSGIPIQFGVLLLTTAFILSLVPYFAGTDFGPFRIPILSVGATKWLKRVGPLVFLACVFLFIPVFPSTALQEDTYTLPAKGFSDVCADSNNTDRRGHNDSNCIWLNTLLTPKGEGSTEVDLALDVVVDMTNTREDGGCSDPHRQAEVFLIFGDAEVNSGMIGKGDVEHWTQKYSLTAKFRANERVPVRVMINPRGCTKARLISGELRVKEVRIQSKVGTERQD